MNDFDIVIKILPYVITLLFSACLFGGVCLYLTRKKDKPFEVITKEHRKLFNL